MSRYKYFQPVTEKNPAYAGTPGNGPIGETCGTCKQCWTQRYRSRKVFKCQLQIQQWTHGPSSDIRKRSAACERWEKKDVEQTTIEVNPVASLPIDCKERD